MCLCVLDPLLLCAAVARVAQSGLVSAMLAAMEEAKQLDVASDGDLASCSPDWSSDEETTRMQILLLQANWGKKPKRMRTSTMTARAKRKRFAEMLRRCRPKRQDEPRTSPHALDDVGAPNAEHERLDVSGAA